MLHSLRNAAVSLLVLTLLTGIVYPLAITAIARLAFPHQSSGSLIVRNGRIVGSEPIGQAFSKPEYFWGRPSATAPTPYNAAASSGSNLGPSNPALLDAIAKRVEQLQAADPSAGNPPVDLVTASASGLDPHISTASARFQAARVARLRSASIEQIEDCIQHCTEQEAFGWIGPSSVHVLKLNLELDERFPIASLPDAPDRSTSTHP
jgi:K+-transporting ATPase ATPase C chain